MAKNITILEGRETRTFGNVEKLQTNLVGGGTQNWIPEDEAASYVDAEDLSVDENGYYEPDAGTFFSSVDVNVEVEPELEEITITENGIYTPSGDGFSQVSVEVDEGGGGDDPSVHGNEVKAIAQTDINAGETVAVQSDSDEPVSVSCPMAGLAAGSNPYAYDGKYLYWIAGTFNSSEVRRKLLKNMESEDYEVYLSKKAGSGYYMPWMYAKFLTQIEPDAETGHPIFGSIFTNKRMVAGLDGGNAFNDYGKFVGINGKLHDNRLRPVHDGYPSWSYGNGGYAISSSRMLYAWGGGGAHAVSSYSICLGFNVGLIGGGVVDTYNVKIPSGFSPNEQGVCQTWGLMPCGTDKLVFVMKNADTDTYGVIACTFGEEEEYEGNTHVIDSEVLAEIECNGTLVFGSDTLMDRWAIATDNGLIVVYSDLSIKEYPRLKSTATPFLAGEYVFLGGSCYKLIGDDAIMVATTSKGTEGQLGVAKHNVRAGEEGTAIILFS